MFEMRSLLLLVVGLPLAASIVTALLGKPLLKERSHWPALLGVGGSLLASLLLLLAVVSEVEKKPVGAIGYESIVGPLWEWADVAGALPATESAAGGNSTVAYDFNVGVTLRVDPLTAIMLVTVTLVATLVVVYSIGYMHDDPGYARYFAVVSLFVFSMTMLVSSSNFLLLYVFWEAVGMCSYLLIGFWFQKREAAAAGMKAFLVNRVGDFGFALGLFLIWIHYHTLNFHDVGDAPGVLGQTRLAAGDFIGGGIGTAICLLLFVGACGKSAQFPLHVWLPDAMEGPTPVSALIHAATMVTAGVYMVVRCMPLFTVSPDALLVVGSIGGITALLAALIALTQTDLKRVLAYSTVSQLGFMFLGLGTGTLAGAAAGMFHLFTHAFFKALLFLGAGSVMHAMGGVIDMRRFGGLRRLMPVTFWTFLCGSLALAGFPLLSGFWSKDAILAALHDAAHEHEAYHWLYLSASATALLTAFYTFRAFFMTFYGPQRIPPEAHHHAHESPSSMTAPLAVLAVMAVAAGAYFDRLGGFLDFLRQTPSLASAAILPVGSAGEFHADIAVTSGIVAIIGIAIAAFMYLGEPTEADWLARFLAPLHELSYRKFFLDELYLVLVVWPCRAAAWLVYCIDRWVIDATVNLVGRLPVMVGSASRTLQGGLLPYYVLASSIAVAALLYVFLI